MWVLLLQLSFDFHLYGIPLSIPSLSVCVYTAIKTTALKCVPQAYKWVLFLYSFSHSVSFGGAFNPFMLKAIINMVHSYCHFVDCFGFVFVSLFLLSLFCFLLLWFDDQLLCCVSIPFSFLGIYCTFSFLFLPPQARFYQGSCWG